MTFREIFLIYSQNDNTQYVHFVKKKNSEVLSTEESNILHIGNH